MSEILLPNGLERIEAGAFDNCALSAVIIPNSVGYIGDNVFANCQLLNSISLPNNLDVINSNLFENCKSLCDINFPVSIKKIGASAFAGCISLKSINISNNVMTIGRYAFSDCKNIDEILLPENLTSIEEYAFNGCSSLTKIDFKNCSNSFTIWEYAFYNCGNLTEVTLPSSLEKLGVGVFWGTNMDIRFEYSEKPLTIYSCKNSSGKIFNPFQFCSVESLSIGRETKVIVPTHLLNGNDYPASTAWGNINSLKKLAIDNSSIPTYVLDNNRKSLEEIKWNSNQKLPNDMSNYPELKALYLYDVNPPSCPFFTNMQYMDMDVFVPKNSLDKYKSAEGWKNFWNIETFDYEVSGINDAINDDYSETRIFSINGQHEHSDFQKLPSGLYIVKKGNQVDKIRIYNE